MKLIIKTIISKLLNKPGKSLRKRYLQKQNNHCQPSTRQLTKHNQAAQQYKQNKTKNTKSNRRSPIGKTKCEKQLTTTRASLRPEKPDQIVKKQPDVGKWQKRLGSLAQGLSKRLELKKTVAKSQAKSIINYHLQALPA